MVKAGFGIGNLALLAILGLALDSCGSAPNYESEISFRNAERPVFFAIGGNDSCARTIDNWIPNPVGSRLYQALQPMLQKIYDNTQTMPEFFVACHNAGSFTLSYVSSWNPVVAYNRSELEVRRAILGKRASMHRAPSFLLGHSYGGWLTMSIMSQLNNSTNFSIVYTIDPISKVFCSYIHPFGCQEVPSDISLGSRQLIAGHSGEWYNFYQNQTFYMRSNFILQATENYKISTSHSGMEQNAQIWDIIYQTSSRIL